jgi:hypothetical protein
MANVQIRKVGTDLCIGTENNIPTLQKCNSRNQLQRWDTTGIDGGYGQLEKAYRSGEQYLGLWDPVETEFSETTGSRIIIDGNNFDTLPYTSNDTAGELKYDKTKKIIHGKYDSTYSRDTCLSVVGNNVGYLSNKVIDKTKPYTDINCNDQWEFLVDCVGDAPGVGYQCNKISGEYECKPGYYGEKCTFFAPNAKDATDAYDSFFTSCYNGNMLAVNPFSDIPTIQDSCERMHRTQAWLPKDNIEGTKPWILWDVDTDTSQRLQDKDIKNRLSLLEIDNRNNSSYLTKQSTNNNRIATITNDKARMASDQSLRVADKNSIIKKNTEVLNTAKSTLTSLPTTNFDTTPEIKSILSSSRLRVAQQTAATQNSRDISDSRKTKIEELKKKDDEIWTSIASIASMCRTNGVQCNVPTRN